MYNEIDLDAIDTTQEPPTEEPARQYYFMAKCRQWVREFEQKNGRRPFAFTQTFGCQMARYDKQHGQNPQKLNITLPFSFFPYPRLHPAHLSVSALFFFVKALAFFSTIFLSVIT